MELGIVGLPQSGKRTIFQLLTGLEADRAPTRDGITYGAAPVRDPRIDRLVEIYQPKKMKYAEFAIALPPDVQPDAARGATWIDPLRRVDAFLHVVRDFEADNVFHIEGSLDADRDLELVDLEFLLADLALVETRLDRLAKTVQKSEKAERERQEKVLGRCREALENETPLRQIELSDEELAVVASLKFLTLKPRVVVFNVGEDLTAAQEKLKGTLEKLEQEGSQAVMLSAAIESELVDLADEERDMFMEDLGITEPASHRLSRAAYSCLGLISYFTVGPDEVRAWTVEEGASAPRAAGKIHSDLERGFIRADTVAYEDFIAAGSEKAARDANHYRLNGKDYVVKDGDIMEIRFSV